MGHLFQFRFGATEMFYLCPPPYFINAEGLFSLSLFWIGDKACTGFEVRDIYRLEFSFRLVVGYFSISLQYVSSARICASAGRRQFRHQHWKFHSATTTKLFTSATS